jgi:L-threonylcarbamoyladenylate synthase
MSPRVTDSVSAAVAVLRQGGLVGLPTETVYGLAGDAFRPMTVARIFAAKNRPEFDPLIVHLATAAELPRVARDVPAAAKKLADRFWPGPLTLVLPRQPEVPDLVTSGLDTVAVRVPDHPLARQVLHESGLCLAAPSANPFGGLSPTTAEHVERGLGDRVDLILDGGPCRVGVESTIIHIDSENRATLLRPGGLPLEAIEATIGPVDTPTSDSDDDRPMAPGMLLRHYAPSHSLRLVEDWPPLAERGGLGCLAYGEVPTGFGSLVSLPADADLTAAAARFFPALHQLDEANVVGIVARRFPEHGLGRALNDRLTRAAAKEPACA